MKYNKDRMALLAGIDGRDEYFGKTLRENFAFGGMSEAEDDLDAAEDAEDDTPVDVEGGEEEAAEEAPAEDMVSKEDVAGALADVLGVDAGEITALVSGDEGEEDADDEEEGEDEEDDAEEGDDEEGEDLDLDLGEADEKDEVEEAYEADEKAEEDDAVNEIRRIVRRELASMIKESKQKNIERKIRAARRHKSVAVAMGYKK